MAYREIDPGPAPEGNFVKFEAIGDKFIGRYVSVKETTNNFGRKQNQYTFKNKQGEYTLDANYDLDRRLKAAQLKPGYACMITFVSILEPRKEGENGMKVFKLMVDDAAPAPKAPPPPADDDFLDDVPF